MRYYLNFNFLWIFVKIHKYEIHYVYYINSKFITVTRSFQINDVGYIYTNKLDLLYLILLYITKCDIEHL